MDDFTPQCMKCGSRHFFTQPCVSHAPVYQTKHTELRTGPIKVVPLTCPGCFQKDALIAELEVKLRVVNGDAIRAKKRREYQRDYMRRRRERLQAV